MKLTLLCINIIIIYIISLTYDSDNLCCSKYRYCGETEDHCD